MAATITTTALEGYPYRVFIKTLKSQKTKDKYSKAISGFAKWKGVSTFDDLLLGDPKSLKADVMEYLWRLEEDKLSSSIRSSALAVIKHFYEMNEIGLAWKAISKCIGERELENEDRPYNIEEIKKLLGVADLKYRAMIHLMLSSGVRIGAIPSIKYGHLQKMPKHNIFKISIYKKSKEAYFTFCTPEAYNVITEYLDQRKRLGEVLTDKSPLFRTDPNPSNMNDIKNAKQLGYNAIKTRLHKMLIKCGVAKYQPISKSNKLGKRRNDVQMAHGLRKFFASQMENADVGDFDNEALMGHKTGLRGRYRKTPEKRFVEYLKAVDLLTINEENRLKTKVEELEEKNKEIETLKVQMAEMRETQILESKLRRDPNNTEAKKRLDELYMAEFGVPGPNAEFFQEK